MYVSFTEDLKQLNTELGSHKLIYKVLSNFWCFLSNSGKCSCKRQGGMQKCGIAFTNTHLGFAALCPQTSFYHGSISIFLVVCPSHSTHVHTHVSMHTQTQTCCQNLRSTPLLRLHFLSFTKTWEKESLHAAEPRTSLNNTNEEMMVLRETAASLGLRKAHSAHSTQAGVSEGWVLWPWLIHSWPAHSCGGELFLPPAPTGSQKVTLYRQFSV